LQKYHLFTVFALMACLVPCATAQTAVEASLGLGIPTGDLGDNWNSGLSLGGGVYLESSPFSMFGFCADYHSMGLDKDQYTLSSNDIMDGGSLSFFSLCLEGRLKTGSMQNSYFYAGAGGGLYSIGMSDLTVGTTGNTTTHSFDRENKIGGFIGGGFAVPLNPQIKVGGKARFHFFSIGDDHGFEDLTDMNNFITLRALVMFFL